MEHKHDSSWGHCDQMQDTNKSTLWSMLCLSAYMVILMLSYGCFIHTGRLIALGLDVGDMCFRVTNLQYTIAFVVYEGGICKNPQKWAVNY